MDFSSKEYLHTFEALREGLLTFKTEQNELRYQIYNLYQENKKLTNELREHLHDISESYVGQLEQKLDAAVASKNAAIEMWQDGQKQLEKQDDLLIGKKSIVATERNEFEKQLHQINNDHIKGLNVLSRELSSCQSELLKTKDELNNKHSELERCKVNFDSAYKELDVNKRTISDLSSTNQQLKENIVSLKSLMSDSSETIDTLTRELTAMKRKNANLSTSVSDLKEQNNKLKSEVLVFEKDAKDSLLTAQEAILQKKEIIYKEEQYLKEIEVLKSSIDIEIQKVSMRYKVEIKDIQKKAKEKTQNLILEIQHLHEEIGEKQNMFERANREKQSLESKMELLFSESSTGMPVSNSSFNDMCKRLTMAERARNEFELKVSSLEISLRDLKSAKEQEIQYLLEKQSSLKERTETLLNDFNQASSDRIKLSDDVTKLRKKCYELEQELKNLRTKHLKDMAASVQESSNKLQTLQEQQKVREEHYKNTCNELHKLLYEEFEISNKWKMEVEDLISKSECKINELCENIIQLRHNNSELINILHLNNAYIPKEAMYLINVDSNV